MLRKVQLTTATSYCLHLSIGVILAIAIIVYGAASTALTNANNIAIAVPGAMTLVNRNIEQGSQIIPNLVTNTSGVASEYPPNLSISCVNPGPGNNAVESIYNLYVTGVDVTYASTGISTELFEAWFMPTTLFFVIIILRFVVHFLLYGIGDLPVMNSPPTVSDGKVGYVTYWLLTYRINSLRWLEYVVFTALEAAIVYRLLGVTSVLSLMMYVVLWSCLGYQMCVVEWSMAMASFGDIERSDGVTAKNKDKTPRDKIDRHYIDGTNLIQNILISTLGTLVLGIYTLGRAFGWGIEFDITLMAGTWKRNPSDLIIALTFLFFFFRALAYWVVQIVFYIYLYMKPYDNRDYTWSWWLYDVSRSGMNGPNDRSISYIKYKDIGFVVVNATGTLIYLLFLGLIFVPPATLQC